MESFIDYNFEITGKMKLENTDGNKYSGVTDPEPIKPFWKKSKVEIIWWVIFALIIILGFTLPEGKFLELLYLFHKKLTYSVAMFFVIWETYQTVIDFIRRKDTKEIIKHLLLSLLIFIIVFKLNLLIYEKYVGPKLTTIKLELKNKTEVSKSITEVEIFTRNIEVPIYLIVETPQGTQWVQPNKRFVPNNQFKANWVEKVHLGGGYIGLGEIFRIFAIGSEEDLKVGVITSIPSHSIISNELEIKRSE